MSVNPRLFLWNEIGVNASNILDYIRDIGSSSDETLQLGESNRGKHTEEFVLQPNSTLYLWPSVLDEHYQLNDALQLTVEQGELGEFIVSDPNVNVFGAGNSISGAINEYISMLLDLYAELEESEEILSRALIRQLQYLRMIISRC